MIKVHPEYILDTVRNSKAVKLSMEEWTRILEELEELDDIRSYDLAKNGNPEAVPFEQAVCEIQEDNRI